MIQREHETPNADLRPCTCGRQPRLIESRGNRTITWHFECWPCRVVTPLRETTAEKLGLQRAFHDWQNSELLSVDIRRSNA